MYRGFEKGRLLRFCAAVLAAALLFTGCGKTRVPEEKPVKEEKSTVANEESTKKDATPTEGPKAELSTSLDDIMPAEYQNKLELQEKSKDFFKASPKLGETVILDIIGKSEAIDPQAVVPAARELRDRYTALVQNHNFEDYDFRLRFKGHKDILFSTSDNSFNFEGEKKLYRVYGRSSFWDKLWYDEANGVVTFRDNNEITLAAYDDDMDGDGRNEKVTLVDDGRLMLSVDDKSVSVSEISGWSLRPYTAVQAPLLEIIDIGGSKAMVMSMVWATNKIGSTASVWVYRYKDGNIQKSWDLGQSLDPKFVAGYDGGDAVTLKARELNINTSVKINREDYYGSIGSDTEKIPWMKENFNGPEKLKATSITGYSLKDLDGDGQKELMTQQLLQFNMLGLYLGRMYTVYEFKGQAVTPVKAVILPNYDLEPMKAAIMEVLMLNGSIKTEGLNPGDFGGHDAAAVKTALEDMAKAGQLVNRDGAYYVR